MGVRHFQRRAVRNFAGALVLAGFLAYVLRMVERIQTGRGIDLFMTKFGLEVNAVSALICFGVVLIVMIGGEMVHWASKRWPSKSGPRQRSQSVRQ